MFHLLQVGYVCTAKCFKKTNFLIGVAFTGEYPIWPLTRQAQMHVSDSYLIYFHIRMRPETDRRISESMRFFSCLHGRGPYPICATWEEKNRNWVTWTMQCAASLSQRSLYCLYRQEHVQTVTAQQNNAWISDSDRMLHTTRWKKTIMPVKNI